MTSEKYNKIHEMMVECYYSKDPEIRDKVRVTIELLGGCDHVYPGGISAVQLWNPYRSCNICGEILYKKD
jgi:hypothetical protein